MKRREAIKLMGQTGIALALPLNLFTKHNKNMNTNYDVIIIGGSYAGLSAALTLGRSLRKTLIIDAGKPCNRSTPHSHNFLTQDGRTPAEIAQVAKSQVEEYSTVMFYDGLAVNGKKQSDGFEITTSQGDTFFAKKLVFATGVKDVLPNIKGLADCWGKSVIHCPYCHGYEYKGQQTAILADAKKAMHLAPLLKNLSKNVTIITQSKAEFSNTDLDKLSKNNIALVEKQVAEIQHNNGQLSALAFTDGTHQTFDCVYADVPTVQTSTLPQDLGCALNENGRIEVNFLFKTSEDGIFACGDNSSPLRSVATAVYGGNVTGSILNMELSAAEF